MTEVTIAASTTTTAIVPSVIATTYFRIVRSPARMSRHPRVFGKGRAWFDEQLLPFMEDSGTRLSKEYQ